MDSADLPQPALQVLRVACLPDQSESGHKGANSKLYGACARAARSMGCLDLWTFTEDDEPGTSLKAAGWIQDVEHESRGGTWNREERPRGEPAEGGPKVRWWAPWSRQAEVLLRSSSDRGSP